MGAISTVMTYGSEPQKRLAADLVLSGDKPAICITEPDAGSDTTAMTTRAEKRGNRWGLVLRQPIYEKDRLDPVDPSAKLVLDQNLLKSFPEGYRHLAYLQSKIGYKVKTDMPGIEGPELEKLYARGSGWLKGEAL